MEITLLGQTSVFVAKVAVMVHKLDLEVAQILSPNTMVTTVLRWDLR